MDALTAEEIAALPAPWGQVMRALEALNSLGDTRHALLEAQIAQLHAELGEIRDELNTRALKAVPPLLCVVCGTAIEPDARYFTCDGAPRHPLCDEATV